ncbi:MAG: hypothetical protein AB7J35_07195 [Dehalococcoidia bacterium]
MKLRYLLSLSLVGVLLLGACGGDDDDNSGDDSGGAAATSTSPSDATKTSEQPTFSTSDNKTPSGGSSGSESANSSFEKLAEAALSKTYQATYDMELTLNGEVQKGTATYANKSPNFAAILSLSGGTAGSLKLTLINDGKDSYVCTDFGIGGNCSKSSGGIADSGVDIKKQLEGATTGKEIKEVEKRTIAGRTARCFEATDTTTKAVTTYCMDAKDNIMLALETGGTMKLTATEVSTNVDDKLFELPYPVN